MRNFLVDTAAIEELLDAPNLDCGELVMRSPSLVPEASEDEL